MYHHSLLRIVLVVTWLFLGLGGHAQTTEKVKVKVRISSDKEAADKMEPQSVLLSTPGTVMYLRDGSASVRAFQSLAVKLDLYDVNKLTYIRSQNPADKLNGETLYVEDLVHFAGGPLLVATTRKPKEGIVEIHTSRVDPLLTKASAPFERACQFTDLKVKGNKAVVSAGGAVRSYFMVRVSPDSSHMAVVSPELRDEESGAAIYMVAVIDRELKTVWQRSVDVGANVRKSDLLDVEVDHSGNVFALVKNSMGNRDVKKGEILFDIKLFKLNGEQVNETRFGLGGTEFVKSAMLKHLKDGRILCTGIYSEVDKPDLTLGVFGATAVPGSSTLENVRKYGFKEEEEEEEVSVHGMVVVDVLSRSDGGYYIIAERFGIGYSRDTDGRTYPYYVHGYMYCMSVDATGERQWNTVFRRYMRTQRPHVGNVYPVVFDDHLFVFLLDSEELAEKRNDVTKRYRPSDIARPYSAQVSFDKATGKFKVKPVLRTEKETDFISGYSFYPLGAGRYLALGTEKLNGGRFLPVRIEFSKEEK